MKYVLFFFFFQAEDGIRDVAVTGVQTCALPISTEREQTTQNRLPAAEEGSRTDHNAEVRGAAAAHAERWQRSEEHTSELQSRLHLVCRLLLEKKKKNRRQRRT